MGRPCKAHGREVVSTSGNALRQGKERAAPPSTALGEAMESGREMAGGEAAAGRSGKNRFSPVAGPRRFPRPGSAVSGAAPPAERGCPAPGAYNAGETPPEAPEAPETAWTAALAEGHPAPPPAASPGKSAAALNPAALRPAELAFVLAKAGGAVVSEADIEDDLAAGAPHHADGTLALADYAAWLLREAGE